jgi:hypothetical protein
MGVSNRKPRAGLVALSAALLCAALPIAAGAQEGAAGAGQQTSAVWTPRELHFLYQGFTSTYSCDGLQAKVRHVLLQLGARKDLSVLPSGCTSPYGRPDPFPAVNIKMHVLTPADAKGTPANAPTVAAHWQRVRIRLDRDPVWEAGDCELLEQIKQRILPLFTTRNVDYVTNCIPNQLQPGGTRLSAELLFPDAKEPKPAPAASP